MFDESVAHLRELYSKVGSSARVDDFTINKSIFVALDAVRESVETATEKSFSNTNLAVLEDICGGTNVALVRSTTLNLTAIYTAIVKKAPGYVVRNILNAMLAICNGKTASNASRECAVLVITAIMLNKPNDCANQTTEIVQLLGRLVKLTDLALKISCFKCAAGILDGSGSKIGDLHAEILKLAVRFSADKSVEIRVAVADIMRLVAQHSVGFTTVPMDQLLPAATRGLEDEAAVVQDAFAAAVAAVFCEQISAYLLSQEQAKVGAARGGNSSKTAKKPAPLSQRMSITKLTMTTKKIVEEWDFKSVVTYLHKQLMLGSNALRTGYLAVLGYLVRTLLPTLSPEEFEWLVISTIEVLKDSPALRELSYEEQAYLRCKFSHFLRASVTASVTEPQLLSYVSLLMKHISTVESSAHSDLELQLVLAEVSHVLGILGPACASLVEEVNMGASIYLRHSNFGVRAASAQVLGNLAVSVPAIATEFLRGALLNAQSQVKQLLQFDPIELTPDPEPTGAPMSEAEQQQALTLARRRNSKEQERLQRIYFFHGHTLVLSVLLKHAAVLPSGLPRALVDEVFALGIELLQQDVMSVPPIVRHVVCSVVRAGSLIVASCISMGSATLHAHLPQLLQTCETIFQVAAVPASPSPHASHPPTLTHSSSTGSLSGAANAPQGGAKTDELVYEVMCVEAALVCLSTILRFCPETLSMGASTAATDAEQADRFSPSPSGCLGAVVEGLEVAFKALRTKYQPRLRAHFRFRTLHAMMLECFTLLPPGAFPTSCQSVFVEALRVFRDGVAAGYETTLLTNYVSDQFGVVSVGAGQACVTAAGTAHLSYLCEAPMPESLLMMRLEAHATALQKKENEAFMSIFASTAPAASVLDVVEPNTAATTVGGQLSVSPCAHLDARTIDAAVLLLGATFSYQSIEYQDKAVQLCAQAVVQFAKAGGKGLSLFSSMSEDEKRRKDRMNYLTLRSVLATLCAIVHAYPTHPENEEDVPWRQGVVTILYDMLASTSYTIRSASASALAMISQKARAARVVESVSGKIRGMMLASLEKKVIDASSALDNAGYLVALSALWRSAQGMEDVRSLISTTVFDSLRKVTTALPFRAQGLLTLSVFVQDYLTTSADNNGGSDAQDLLEKILGVTDLHVANLNYSTASPTSICADELELFSVCLLRLTNVGSALSLRLYNQGIIEADRVHTRFESLRKGVLNDATSQAVRNETLSFFKHIIPVDTSGKYSTHLLTWLGEIIRRSDDYSVEAINAVLVAMLPVLKAQAVQACQVGLDAKLFVLLDRLCGRSAISHAGAYGGIETRRGSVLDEDVGAQLSACITNTVRCLYSLCEEDVRASPDTRAVHWVLMCRSVALNTRSMGRADDNADAAAPGDATAGEREDGDGFEEGGAPAPSTGGDFGGEATSGSPGVYPVASFGRTQFAAYCREEATAHAPALDYARVQVKCASVRCILIALAHIRDNPLHSDLANARAATESALRNIKGKYTSAASLAAIPKYLPLFLTDTVNLACACATYLIDDKPMLMLQSEAMRLMRQVVDLFLFADDPDTKMSQDASGLDPLTAIVEGRLLHQFTSQLISAVRNGLANTATLYNADLLHHSGLLLCSLIRGGFVTDKIVVRRLVKLVVSYCEQGGNITAAAAGDSAPTTSDPLPVRAPASPTVSAEQAAVLHVVHAGILAELFALGTSTDSQRTRFISSTVKSAVVSMVQEHCASLSPLWFAMIVDAARIMWHDHSVAAPGKRSEAHALDALFGSVSDSGPTTPSSSGETRNALHPLRGGLTYSAIAAPASAQGGLYAPLRTALVEALPVAIAAYICSCAAPSKSLTSPKGKSAGSAATALPAVPPTKVLSLFAVAHSALRSFLASISENSTSGGASEHLFSSLVVLAKKDAPAPGATGPHAYVIPTTEWVDLLDLAVTCSDALAVGAAQRALYELASVLSERAEVMSATAAPAAEVDALWLSLWKISANMLHGVCSGLLPAFNPQKFASLSGVHVPALCTAKDLVDDNVGAKEANFALLTHSVSVLARLSAMKTAIAPYVCHAFTLLPVLVASQSTVDAEGETAKPALTKQITVALLASPSAHLALICAQIQQNLHDWTVAYCDCGKATQQQGSAAVAQVLETSLLVWRAVAVKLESQASIPPPYQLGALILNTSHAAIPTAVLNAAVAVLQSAASDVGPYLAGQLLPAILTRLSFTADSTEVRVLLIKAILLFFSLAPPEQKGALVELFLTPMCAKICEHPTDAEFLLVCGRGVTHLARLEPEVFRTQVPALSERHRTVLQGVMKLALQQVDAGGFGAGGGAAQPGSASGISGSGGLGAPGSGMTINMSKYKK